MTKSIGKYRLQDEIGSSAAAKLYRARDAFRHREVALKTYAVSLGPTPEAKDQFCRELGACSELEHPHIASMVDVGEADGSIYVASEVLSGIDLRRHFEERRSLALSNKLELMAQVCEGLATAHRRGIAHGNLKPGNVFLAGGSDVRVLDFGTGRWVASILAAGGRLPGLAVNHLAPEQILGEFFDVRSDVFSAGLLLYQLLAGNYPFPVPDGVVAREIVHTEPPPLRKVDPGIPEQLEQLVARAISKDPQNRLQTADEFARALRAVVERANAKPLPPAPKPEPPKSEPPKPDPPKPEAVKPEPAKKPSLRKRFLTYTAAGLLTLGIAGTFLSRKPIQASPPPAPTPVAVQPKPVETPQTPVQQAQPEPAPVVAPKPAEDPAQLASVKSLWESGRYAQALALVNEMLAKNPDDAAAKSWKRKIRAAQEAEAEMK